MRSALLACFLLASTSAFSQVSPDTEANVAAIANRVLHDTGVPSASIAFAQNGKLVYSKAFGLAHINPSVPATSSMAYPIGSITKQFTATAVMLLVQQGKLSLEDKVSKYFPELTRSNDVTLRNLMTMTSGYQDFAPQDYIIPEWLKTVDPLTVVHQFATKPLDFEPGTEWQYSNTNYEIVALIVQKVSGEPLSTFIRQHVLVPAGIENVVNTYTDRDKLRVTGYVSVALQPVREQQLEGTGWAFGDGDLAMPASSLVQWDLCMARECLLSRDSYVAMETPFHFTSGKNKGEDSHYGLGIHVGMRGTDRIFQHGGEVGGFVSENVVYPDRKAAIAVLTNEVASEAASQIAREIAPLVLGSAAPEKAETPASKFEAELKSILTGFGRGQIERELFTANANSYFDQAALADFQAELVVLGPIVSVTRMNEFSRGGMTGGFYKVTCEHGSVLVSTYVMPDGKIEQLLITAKA